MLELNDIVDYILAAQEFEVIKLGEVPPESKI